MHFQNLHKAVMLVALLLYPLAGWAQEDTRTRLEMCVQDQLQVLFSDTGKASDALDTRLVTQSVLGRAGTQQLSKTDFAHLEITIASFLNNYFKNNKSRFQGATVNIRWQKERRGSYFVGGNLFIKNAKYAFDATVYFTDEQSCLLYRVVIDSSFTLNSWLKGQQEIRQLLSQYGVSQ